MSTAGTRLSPDERYEAAAIASARQRRNQPRGLVIFGGVLFVGACLALVGAWVSRASAQDELQSQRDETAEVQRLAAELEAYRVARADNAAGTQIFAPDPNFRSKVASMATRAGMENEPPVPNESNRVVQGGVRVDWPYTLTEPDLSTVLEWIRLVTMQIPGTFVSNIEVKPQGSQWRVEVTLSYYEER